MLEPFTITAAFLTGLFGSVHCAAMCGGIVSSLSISSANKGVPASEQSTNNITNITIEPAATSTSQCLTSVQQQWIFSLLYQLGRISSYMLAGYILSGLGLLGYQGIGHSNALIVGQLIAAAFMLALGLYVSKIWQGLLILEKFGAYFWRLISPFAQRIFPINRSDKAFIAGMLWGWLPCGMVYTVLVWSFSSGNQLTGTLMMLAFGLGTLPMLLSISLFSLNPGPILNNKFIAWLCGSLLISFSLWMLVTAITGQPHH